MSSCNSGLYPTGRILRAPADEGKASAFTGPLALVLRIGWRAIRARDLRS